MSVGSNWEKFDEDERKIVHRRSDEAAVYALVFTRAGEDELVVKSSKHGRKTDFQAKE